MLNGSPRPEYNSDLITKYSNRDIFFVVLTNYHSLYTRNYNTSINTRTANPLVGFTNALYILKYLVSFSIFRKAASTIPATHRAYKYSKEGSFLTMPVHGQKSRKLPKYSADSPHHQEHYKLHSRRRSSIAVPSYTAPPTSLDRRARRWAFPNRLKQPRGGRRIL